jgi:Na+-transporting NADH:ubiquinone oxidoreductase subunit NqrC
MLLDSLKTSIQTSLLTKVLSVVVASLLVISGVEGFFLFREIQKTQQCYDVQKTVQAVAKTRQSIVAKEDTKNVETSQVSTSTTVDVAISKLRSKNKSRVDTAIAKTSSNPDPESPTPVLLSEINKDQEICVTNTILLEGWQTFYQQLLDTREKVNVKLDP